MLPPFVKRNEGPLWIGSDALGGNNFIGPTALVAGLRLWGLPLDASQVKGLGSLQEPVIRVAHANAGERVEFPVAEQRVSGSVMGLLPVVFQLLVRYGAARWQLHHPLHINEAGSSSTGAAEAWTDAVSALLEASGCGANSTVIPCPFPGSKLHHIDAYLPAVLANYGASDLGIGISDQPQSALPYFIMAIQATG